MANVSLIGPGKLQTARSLTKPRSYWGMVGRRLLRDATAMIGALILLAMIALALLAPVLPLANPTPTELNTANRLRPLLTEGYPLGTDQLGRDILSRIIWGAQRSLSAGVVAMALSLSIGLVVGLISGYSNSWFSELLMRLIDMMMAFPPIILAIVVVAVLGPGLINAMVAVAIVGIPLYARLVRASVQAIRQEEYVMAAYAVGAPSHRIALLHMLPNIVAPIIVTASFDVGNKILATAGLSFLGLGTQPPQPDWGNMIAEGRRFLTTAGHLSLVPGTAIFLTVLALNFLGDGLRDALDPTFKDA